MIYTTPFLSGDEITPDVMNGISGNATNILDNIHPQYSPFKKFRSWASIKRTSVPADQGGSSFPDVFVMDTNKFKLAPRGTTGFCGDFIFVPDILIDIPLRLKFKAYSETNNGSKYTLKIGTAGNLLVNEENTIPSNEQSYLTDFTPSSSMCISLVLSNVSMALNKIAVIHSVEFYPQSEDV